ncbi:MAG: tetratricopeptide repeat protein [Bacteroidales bacterium]|jgi:tetratricopeptide (TPR) repeat protein
MKKIFIILQIIFISFTAFSQNADKLIRDGNKEYKDGKYNPAEINYRKALGKKKNSLKANYNLGDALYKQEKYEEASKIYQELITSTKNKDTLSKIYHNLGNSLLKQKKYEESINSYKQALKNKPDDKDTKYNLSYALRMIKEEQKKQNQKNKNDKNKNDKKNQQQKQQKNNEDKNKQQQQQKQQLSKEDAERILEAMKNQEKNTNDKLKKEKAVKANAKIEKDW